MNLNTGPNKKKFVCEAKNKGSLIISKHIKNCFNVS